MKADKRFLTVGSLGAVAVSLGAYGAHGLKGKLNAGITADQLNGFDTGVKYHMYHTLALLALLILLEKQKDNKAWTWAYRCFVIGIVLFSGSLYLLCTKGLTGWEVFSVLGPVTPLGGLFFVGGWLLLAFGAAKK